MRQLNLLAYRALEPDIYFLLSISPSIAYERYLEREHFINDSGLELMNGEYFNSVSNYYNQLAHNNSWHVADGTQDPQTVSRKIRDIIDQKL